MAGDHSALEVFLLRTLVRAERKFHPGNPKLVSVLVGVCDDTPGDITVRRSKGHRSVFEFTTTKYCDLNFDEISACNLGLRFTDVLYEPANTPQESDVGTQTKRRAAGKWTFRNEFAEQENLQVFVGADWADHCRWLNHDNSSLVSRVQIRNLNKLTVTDKEGENHSYVLWDAILIPVDSLCPKVILSTLSMVDPIYGYNGTRSIISQPLAYFWRNETYIYRIVSQEVHDLSRSNSPNKHQRVHKALRLLIDQMLEARQVINEMVVSLLVEVADELGLYHPSIAKSQIIQQHLKTLTSYKNMAELDSNVLSHLAKMDLKEALPVFNSQLDQIYTELGDKFEIRFRFRYDCQETVASVTDFSCAQGKVLYPKIAKLILLKVHQIANNNLSSSPSSLEGFNTEFQSDPRLARLTSHNTAPSVPGYDSILFQAMPVIHEQLTKLPGFCSEKRSSLIHLQLLLNEANGYLLKGHTLLCWRTTSEGKSITTVLYMVHLKILERTAISNSAEENSRLEDWLQKYTLPLAFRDFQIVDFVSGALYLLSYEMPRIVFRVFKFRPQFLQRAYDLTSVMSDAQYHDHVIPAENRFHFNKAFSPRFDMMLLAMVYSGFDESKPNIDPPKFRISLSAFALRQPDRIVQVTLDDFESFELPWELNACWEFSSSRRQGFSANSFDLPYSPIRWNTTHKNIYCIWLLAPESHILFGLLKNRFVELSRRVSHRSLCTDLPFVLPSICADRINGMRGLFSGRRVWDPKAQKFIIRVYKMQLKHK